MIRITLDDEQLRALADSNESVELVDSEGRVVGYADKGFSADEVSEAMKRVSSRGPWHSTAELLGQFD